METAPSAQEPVAPPEMSAPARLVGALVSPQKTFESIVRRPGWMLPMAVVIFLSLCITWMIGYRVGWRHVVEKQLEHNSGAESLSQAQKDAQIEQGAKFAPVVAYISVLVATPVVFVVTAGVLLGVFNLLLGTRVQFKTALGIVTHSWMPQVILVLLAMIVLFLKAPEDIDIQNIVASNAGALVGADAAKWWQALAGSLDLFSLWTMALLAMGFSAASPKKVTYGKALACVVGVWLFYLLVKTGMAAAFS